MKRTLSLMIMGILMVSCGTDPCIDVSDQDASIQMPWDQTKKTAEDCPVYLDEESVDTTSDNNTTTNDIITNTVSDTFSDTTVNTATDIATDENATTLNEQTSNLEEILDPSDTFDSDTINSDRWNVIYSSGVSGFDLLADGINGYLSWYGNDESDVYPILESKYKILSSEFEVILEGYIDGTEPGVQHIGLMFYGNDNKYSYLSFCFHTDDTYYVNSYYHNVGSGGYISDIGMDTVKLKMKRTATRLIGYYNDGNDFVEFSNELLSSLPASLSGDLTVKIKFSNYNTHEARQKILDIDLGNTEVSYD